MTDYKLTHDGVAAVAPGTKWRKIDASTPRGTKMLLIHKPSNVAVIGINLMQEHWTHWAPLPTFDGDN